MRSDEQPGSDQIAALRKLTGVQKLKIAEQLYWTARKIKAAGLRLAHPAWTEEQIEEEVRRIFLHART